MDEWIPSAPTTRSYVPVEPSREDDVDLVRVLVQRRHGGAEPNPDLRRALEEDAMKLGAKDANAGTDRAPEILQLDLRQAPSPVIEDSLVRNTDSSSQHLVGETQPLELANAVTGYVEAGAARWPRCGTFDDLGIEPLRSQRPAESEAGDSTTDDQDP